MNYENTLEKAIELLKEVAENCLDQGDVEQSDEIKHICNTLENGPSILGIINKGGQLETLISDGPIMGCVYDYCQQEDKSAEEIYVEQVEDFKGAKELYGLF